MALAQGELTIIQTADGARIDMGGGAGHSVSGPNAVNALMDAYGSRIGKVVDSAGQTTVVNEYKEPPKIEVDPAMLREVPTAVTLGTNEGGETLFGVRYADGTVSHTGAGREGSLEAGRRRSQATLYNEFITDGRTREDFATDQEYQNFLTVKNIRIGQGSYVKMQDASGNSKLVAPNGAVVAEGTAEEIRNAYRNESNKLNLAMASAERSQSFTSNEKQYIMQTQGLSTDEEFNQFVRDDMQKRQQALQSIYDSWSTAANNQGILTEGKNWYQPELPDLTTFIPAVSQSDIPYEEWYKTNIQGQSTTQTDQGIGVTEQTITGQEGTDTTGTGATDTTTTGTDTTGTATTFTGGTSTFQPFVPVATTTTTEPFQTDQGTYPTTGGESVPLQTAGLSATPPSVTTFDNYTGTTMQNLTSQSQKGFGGQRKYRNRFGQEVMVTVDGQGNPLTYVPPGYNPVQGQSEGGVSTSENSPDVQLARKFLGFDGPSSQLTNFLASNPGAAARMGKYQQAMAGMAKNRVGAQEGVAGTTLEDFQGMQQDLITQTMQPIQPTVDQITPEEADFIGETAGQASTTAPYADVATVGTAAQVSEPQVAPTSTVDPTTVSTGVKQVTEDLTAATGTVSEEAQIDAAQQETSAVSDLKAEQGTAIMMDNPVQREIQDGELVSGAADAEKAAAFTEQIEAATAEPSTKATVAGQLEGLMAQFEGGETPAWAAGSMRAAMASLSARGLGASSLAGQAVIQAAMESALPIAQMDAQTQANFEAQNLSNRQQRAILAAQQRASFMQQEFDQEFQSRVINASKISDVANMNFTAEQQIALENSRAANTMNLQNLSNSQAMVMAEAAALAQLDMANLNNRQQTAVQNAQNFLQIDMQNLANEQQAEMFKAQQNIQALFTDQAAENAAAQFNATSENQTNQFFANLSTQVGQFNVSQQNAMDQFNVNTTNAMRQFNSEMQQQRDLFNAQNGLVVAQANAQWRQNIATLNNAAQNESNMEFAKTINAMTMKNLDEIWQRERDIMSFAFTADQSAMDRALQIILGDKELEVAREKLSAAESAADTELAMRFLFGTSPGGILGGLI